MSKYLLLDGNNLSCRCACSNDGLTTKDGIPSGFHFGITASLINLKQQYPDYQMLLAWDGKSGRRKKEAKEGVDKGLIPDGYKENRTVTPEPIKTFYAQADVVKRCLAQLGIPQIRYDHYEADDVIATYAKTLGKDNEVVLVTSDKDYFAMLSDNVSIYDGMKQMTKTKKDFVEEFGIEPHQWTDVGALMGDDGDNIYGVDGVGKETALKMIRQYGAWDKAVQACVLEVEPLRQKYPDLCTIDGGKDKYQQLIDMEKKSKVGKKDKKYKYLYYNMPFTGVLYEVEFGNVKITKTTLLTAMFQDVVKLAYSLKKVDDDIENLPEITEQERDLNKFIEYLRCFDIYSLDNVKLVFA